MSDVAIEQPPKKRERKNYGHAITRDGKIRYTSVSQIKMFDTTVDGGCPRKWAYSYRFGIKLARTDAQAGGSDHAEKWEHYLTTGEDVLPPVLQPAKKFAPVPGKDLECERPLGDLENALRMRDMLLKGTFPESYASTLTKEIERFAGLSFAGIPVDGAADCRHTRGEFVDSDQILKKDPTGTLVVHIDDLKTTSRIYPHKVMKGPNAGSIIPTYCKTDAEVCEDVQMIGYGRHAINNYPGMTHARLSLIYANTQKREAVKRTGIISVEQILARSLRIENVVRQMEQVATAQRIEDVEPNVHACDSYTHVDPRDPTKTLKGCGYRYQCPLQASQFVSTMLGTHKESSTMSLCDSVPGVASPAPVADAPTASVAPPLDATAHEAEVAAERAKLMAAMNALPAPPTAASAAALGFCTKCGTQLTANNTSRSPKTQELRHVGCAAEAAPPPPPPSPPLPISVNSPDQPRAPSLLDAADPPPAEEIVQITDPTLRAQVEQHAHEHVARAAAEAARLEAEKVAAGTSSWCSGGLVKLVVNSTMSVEGYTCKCSKHWTVKKLGPEKEGDHYVVTVPRHKPKKDEIAAAAPVAPTAPVAPVAVSAPQQMLVAAASPPPPPLPQTVHEWVGPAEGGFANGPIPATNGHTNGSTKVVPGYRVREGELVFRVALDGRAGHGYFLSVIAETMAQAMTMAEQHLAGRDEVKSIEKLVGTVID